MILVDKKGIDRNEGNRWVYTPWTVLGPIGVLKYQIKYRVYHCHQYWCYLLPAWNCSLNFSQRISEVFCSWLNYMYSNIRSPKYHNLCLLFKPLKVIHGASDLCLSLTVSLSLHHWKLSVRSAFLIIKNVQQGRLSYLKHKLKKYHTIWGKMGIWIYLEMSILDLFGCIQCYYVILSMHLPTASGMYRGGSAHLAMCRLCDTAHFMLFSSFSSSSVSIDGLNITFVIQFNT